MELRRSDSDGLTRLASLWKTTPGAEFEAMLTGMELTSWQDVIQYLRGLGMREIPQIVKLNICLSNDIRITLEGAGVIQAYCRDNRLGDRLGRRSGEHHLRPLGSGTLRHLCAGRLDAIAQIAPMRVDG